ncbi:MAG: PDZ domain-containing protein [Clostridia bacterium]|nr:PDZ domain-containing protein [Clostridia bacterium]
MKNLKYGLVILLVAALVVPGLVMANNENGKVNSYLDLMIEKSNSTIDTKNVTADMITGAFSETDKFSYFQAVETYNTEQNTYINAEYVGIGVSMTAHIKGVEIVSVFEYSPASLAGLKSGDIIISVNHENITGKSLEYIASLVKGPVNTYVTLGILKNNEGPVLYYDLSRQVVAMKTVKSYIINHVGYVYISSFTNETGKEFKEALEKFNKKGISDVILDLRDNGGGTLQGCIDVARAVLSECVVTKMDFKYSGYLDIRYEAMKNDETYNMVLLVNENSASASEVVTGALKDNKAAVVVGEKTFGKSVVQSSYEILTPKAYDLYSAKYAISDMFTLSRYVSFYEKHIDTDYLGAAKLTIGEYVTPNGSRINLVGIEPDINVEYDGSLFININNLDNMLWIRAKYDVGMTSYEIYRAKVILKEFGYEVGTLNVLYDETFKQAVKQFQDDYGLYPYGVLDYTTQDNINNILRLSYINEDIQLKKAFEVIKEGK